MASSGSEQQLRFRWNDHMQHISKVLTLQRFEEQFCDVTLVSEDGFVMKAHQAILASTSAYFQRVFSDITADQHPMVVLRGANFREMSCLLDYMYQGSTQVHQSLMESVLEVADMLEVKGLSQIRANNSIKKFMVPPSSSTTTTSTTTTHVVSGDNTVGHSKTPDEQSGSHTPPDEQLCRDSQPKTSELENTWMRLSGNCMNETRSKETPRIHVEGTVTPTEEPPPSSHTRVLPCQDSSSNQESQEESQMSGMDLSMAKNEPWSPKESTPNENKNSPSRKRRKLLEGFCSEETFEPVSDPDWGRIGSKVDDRPLCQPRTISFTSITSEADSRLDESFSEENDEYYTDFNYHPNAPTPEASCNELPMSATSALQHGLQKGLKEKCKETVYENYQLSTSISSKGPSTCPCKSSVPQDGLPSDAQESVIRQERSFPKEGRQPEIVVDSHPSHVILGYYGTSQGANMLMHLSDGIADQNISRSSLVNDSHGSPVILSIPSSCILSQNPLDGSEGNIKRIEMSERDSDVRKVISQKAVVESLDNSLPLGHPSETSEVGLFANIACSNTEGSMNCNINSTQESIDDSHTYLIGQRQPSTSNFGKSVEISPSGFSVGSPMQLMHCSSVSSTSTPSHISEDYIFGEPLNAASSEDAEEDPLDIGVHQASNNVLVCSDQAGEKETPVTSFVNLKHREHLLLRDSDLIRKTQCLLEERLTRPKNDVKRPMNPYMLFQNEMKKKVIAEYPGESYQVTLKRLGYLWKHLSVCERAKWQARADDLKKEHKLQNPNYHYNPYEAFKKRQQYLKSRMERRRLYRVASGNVAGAVAPDTMMVSPNLYKPVPKDKV